MPEPRSEDCKRVQRVADSQMPQNDDSDVAGYEGKEERLGRQALRLRRFSLEALVHSLAPPLVVHPWPQSYSLMIDQPVSNETSLPALPTHLS